MEADARAHELLAAWRQAQERGESVDPEELIARHPEHAEALRRGFAAAALLERAAGMACEPSGDGGVPEGPLALPRLLGDYRILKELGRGGMGAVYEAEQLSMHRKVALKVLYPSVTLHPKAVERFRREAQAAGRLHHTNIVAVHGMGCEGGHWFYAMERIDGRSLQQVLADLRHLEGAASEPSEAETSSGIATSSGRRDEYARLARSFAGLADALATAHEAGIVHRDVKPANVLLDATGTLKLVDFGLARVRDEGAGITATGDVVGTPLYMSPEQARSGDVDARSDVYSLGATLYEVLTRHPPVEGKDVTDVVRRLLTHEPVAPRRWNRRVPRDLETIVARAMAKEPARRYASASDMSRDLMRFAEGEAIRARRIGLMGRAWRSVRRHKMRTALVAAVVALAGTAFLLDQRRRADEAARAEIAYEQLLSDADMAEAREGRPDSSSPSDGTRARLEAPLLEAIRLVPTRWQAYARLAAARRGAERFDLLEAARSHGMPERHHRLLRASFLRDAGRAAEAEEEILVARRMPVAEESSGTFVEATLALQDGRADEALGLFDRALERAHGRSQARRVLLARAKTRHARGDLRGALEDYVRARDGSPAPGDAAFIEGQIALLWKRLGRPDLAKQSHERALSLVTTGNDQAWIDLVGQFEWAKEREWANELLDLLPERLETRPLIVVSRAQRHWDGGEREEALRVLDDALRGNPDDAVLQRARGAFSLDMGRLDEAFPFLERAYDLDPGAVNAGNLAQIYQAYRNEPATALALVNKAAHADPQSFVAQLNLSWVLFQQERHVEALAAIERAVAIYAPHEHALWLRMHLLRLLGRHEEAVQAAEKAILLLPAEWIFYRDGAFNLEQRGRYEDALRMVDRGLQVAPSSSALHHSKGFNLERLGRREEALREFDRARTLDTTNEEAQQAYATTLHALGRTEEALHVADEVLLARPRDARWLGLRAVFRGDLGRVVEAVRDMDEAMQIDPTAVRTDPSRHVLLAKVGRFRKALEVLGDAAIDEGERQATRGLYHLALGEADAARRVLDAMEADPVMASRAALYRIGLLRYLGDLEASRKLASALLPERLPDTYDDDVRYLAAVAGRPEVARFGLASPVVPHPGGGALITRASIHALLGEKDAALRNLEAAADAGYRESALRPLDPDFADLRDDPRYAAVMERILIR